MILNMKEDYLVFYLEAIHSITLKTKIHKLYLLCVGGGMTI